MKATKTPAAHLLLLSAGVFCVICILCSLFYCIAIVYNLQQDIVTLKNQLALAPSNGSTQGDLAAPAAREKRRACTSTEDCDSNGTVGSGREGGGRHQRRHHQGNTRSAPVYSNYVLLRSFAVNEAGRFLQWSSYSQGNNTTNSRRSYLHPTAHTPVLPADGIYFVYAHITWVGRGNNRSNLCLPDSNAVMFADSTLVLLDGFESSATKRDLASSFNTQYNQGYQVNTTSNRRIPVSGPKFAEDSSFMSLVTPGRAGQTLAVRVSPTATCIDPDGDKTFLGFYKLSD